MSDMKCPYCNKTLHCGATLKSDKYLIDLYQCANPECESTEFLVGCKEFWDILGQHIRTRKALDVAVKRLGYIKNNYKSWTPDRDAQMIAQAVNGLDEIKTALEQKDVK